MFLTGLLGEVGPAGALDHRHARRFQFACDPGVGRGGEIASGD